MLTAEEIRKWRYGTERQRVALLKPVASSAGWLHSADEAVARSQWRFLLKWLSDL
jgi:hypothetical protein